MVQVFVSNLLIIFTPPNSFLRKKPLKKSRIAIVLLTLSGVLLMAPASILPVHAFCSGNVQDSWTPRTGVTITIVGNACPGIFPQNSTTCTRDSSISIDNGTVSFIAFGNYPGYGGGGNYNENFGIGCANLSKTYGPFYSPNTPNCGYTEYTVNARDTVTGQTHQLYVLAVGQTRGSCPY